jgi:hypothetical protein
VRAAVLSALPGAVVATGDPAVAAAWLAVRRVTTPDPLAAAALHTRMVGRGVGQPPDRSAVGLSHGSP